MNKNHLFYIYNSRRQMVVCYLHVRFF